MSLIAEADFGLSLLRGALQNQTIVLSPISVALALSLVHLGAKGTSKEQIKNALCGGAGHDDCVKHFSDLQNSIVQKNHPYLKNWRECSKPGNMLCVPDELKKQYTPETVPADAPLLNTGVVVNIANQLFASNEFEVKKSFLDDLKSKFDANLQNLDYKDPNKAAEIVNDFVWIQTAGKINRLVGPDSFENDKVALLINAVFFHGRWADTFTEYWSKENIFYKNDKEVKEVTFMNNWNSYLPYTTTDDFTVLSLPFKDNTPFGDSKYRLTIALPKKRDGLAEALKKLTGEKLQELITSETRVSANVTIPKFKIEAKLSLNSILNSIGITDPFTDNADLSGISDKPLKLGNVEHKAIIDVNEKGATAAASTAIEIQLTSAPPKATVSFVADQPFLFVLSKDGHILFTGQYYG